jgi:hypothetical protein
LGETTLNWLGSMDRPVVPHVLLEHLEELAALLVQRRKLLFSPEVPLRRLKQHDDRIEAHLDGLRTGGPAAIKIAEERLAGDPWLIVAAARVWVSQGDPSPQAVMERLKTAEPDSSPAWKEAFRAIPPRLVQRLLPQDGAERLPSPALEIAADAWGWHGLLLPVTASVLTASPQSSVRFSLARHLAQNSPATDRLLEDGDTLVRRAALWSLALRNPKAAVERSRQLSRAAQPDPFGLRVLGLLGERTDGRLLVSALAQPGLKIAALHALRDLAHPEFADAVLEIIEGKDEDAATAAREVFESLVGKLPSPDPEKPAPPGISLTRFQWQQIRPKLDLSVRRLEGEALAWASDPGDEPMERVWRAACFPGKPETAWLRREVPDGFFTGISSPVAIPGE